MDLDEDAHVVWRVGVVERQFADQRSQIEDVVLAPGVALVRAHHDRCALGLGVVNTRGRLPLV